MKDLYKAIDSLNNILNEAPPQGRQDGPGTRQGTTPKPKPAGPAAYNSVGDMMKAIATPGRQGVSDPNQSAKNVAAAQPKPAPAAPKPKPAAFTGRPDDAQKPAAAPKINPAVPAAGPVRANPIDPQAMAATRAAASVVNAPKPAAPAPRAKVKATAANTKDFDKTVALQKKLGVTADGIMGPQTRAAMAAAKAKQGSPAPTGTARKVSTVAPGADAAPKAFTPIAGAGDRKPGATAAGIKIDRGNKAVARDFKKIARGAAEIASGGSSGGILDKIGAGISSIFKPSTRSVRGRRQAAAPAAGPNAAGSNFATAADGTISRTDNPRQPGDAAPTNRFDRTKARMQAARDRKAARGDTTPVSVSDVQDAAAQSRAAVAATAAAPTTRTVRQRVTDPDEKAAIMRQMNTARERQRLALAAGSTDPDDIRAYQRRMANTRGTGAAGGTDPNTF
jgi:hypothetical protein